MIYLILSVLCTAAFILLFKVFESYDIHVFQAIVFNYWVAFFCGLLFLPLNSFAQIRYASWLPFAFLLGTSFITVFTLTGKTVKLFNVSTASVAMKLGLVFPVMFAFILYNEEFNSLKLLGIVFAFIAVVLSTYRSSKEHQRHTFWEYILPFIVFVGNGLCDSGVQYANKTLLSNNDISPFVTINFISAAMIGSIFLALQIIQKKAVIEWKNVVGGIAVGVPNYFSILFMLKALENMKWGSSVIFPVSNLSIIACSSIAAYFLFNERISKVNSIGLAFAVASILLIVLSNYM